MATPRNIPPASIQRLRLIGGAPELRVPRCIFGAVQYAAPQIIAGVRVVERLAVEVEREVDQLVHESPARQAIAINHVARMVRGGTNRPATRPIPGASKAAGSR